MNAPTPAPLSNTRGEIFPRCDTPILFDFDGILAESIWPASGIGPAIAEGVALLTHYHLGGYRIVVFTSRPWHDKPLIEEWVRRQAGVLVEVVCGKPLATLYIDDRAYRPEWVKEGR